MAFALGIYENGAQGLDLNAGAFAVLEYAKQEPKRLETGEYDLYNPVQDEVRLQVGAASRAAWDAAVNGLEKLLVEARTTNRALELAHIPDLASTRLFSRIWSGWVERKEAVMQTDASGDVTAEIVAHLTRQPDWLTAEAQVSLVTDVANNGAGNYFVLPPLTSELPPLARLRITGSGGNIASAKILGVAILGKDAANFTHQLMAGSYSARAAAVTTLNDATLVGGAGQKYTPTNKNAVSILQWTLSGAAANALFGSHWLCVRYRDRAGAPNFWLSARVGVSVGGQVAWGAYTTEKKTRTVNGSQTNETGWLDLGLLSVPFADTLVFELRARAAAVTDSLDINYLALFPYGGPLPGKGLQVVTYPAAIGSRRAYVQSYAGEDAAWLADASDVKLARSMGFPQGGDLMLPANISGARGYVVVTSDLASGNRHDHSVSLDATLFYRARYIHAEG